MSIALLVMTDGRGEYLTRTLASFDEMVSSGSITRRIIHDDSGDPDYAAWLTVTFPNFRLVTTLARSGFGGAIRSAWRHMTSADETYIFGLEDDFEFLRPVDLDALATVLGQQPHIVQLALRRQPWNAAEHAAGGVVEQNPAAFAEHTDAAGRVWLEHRQFWTTNPALFRRTLCKSGWPDVDRSEGRFSHQLLRDGSPEVSAETLRFGYWGHLSDGPWVTHIGQKRVGTGY